MIKDPFPDRLLPHHYPTIDDPALPRPKLSPDLEKYFYGEQDRTNLNSLPWYAERALRELLPPEDQLSYAIKLRKKAAVADCSGSGGGPTELLPDLMHTFLVDMIMDSGRLELKKRWGAEKYRKIMNLFKYLDWRICMRRKVFRDHAKKTGRSDARSAKILQHLKLSGIRPAILAAE